MKKEEYLGFSEDEQNVYLNSLSEKEREAFLSELSEYVAIKKWLEDINKDADEKASELSAIFTCKVEPAVFVLEPLKDAAVAYVKEPDAEQGLKLIYAFGTDNTQGLKLAVQSQLIRQVKDKDGNPVQASDPRFMDANGKYDTQWSTLNTSILLRMQKVIGVLQDQFKKK